MRRWLCACGHDLMPPSLKYVSIYFVTVVYLKEILQSAFRTFWPKQRQTEVNWEVKLELLIIMLNKRFALRREKKEDLSLQEHVHVSLNIKRLSPTKFKFKEARAVVWSRLIQILTNLFSSVDNHLYR